MKLGIGKKLLLSYGVLVVFTLFIAGALLNPLFKNYLIMSKKNELVRQANEIAALTQKYYRKEINETTFSRTLESLNSINDTNILIIDQEGRLVAPIQNRPGMGRRGFAFRGYPRGTQLSKEEVGQVLSGQIVIKEGMSPHFNMPVISVAVPVEIMNSAGVQEVKGAVLSFSPVFLVTDIVKKVYYYLGISSIIAILLAAVIAYYFSRRISHPLKKMNEAALAMAQGNYKTVIPSVSNDELGELAISMNYLGQQLDANVTALEEEKGKLESIVSSINEGLVAVDKEGKIILINPVLEKIFITATRNILGKSLAEISPFPELTRPFVEALNEGKPISTTFKAEHTSYKIIVAPIQQEKVGLLGAVGILQDISELEKVEQMRREFITNVSHELRAPITVIRGFTECLLDGVIQHSPDYYHEIIKKETLRLERLIKDIMELSLLQAGKIELDLEEVDMNSLVEGTVNKFMLKAKEKNITLTTNATTVAGHKIAVYCDADRMEQLLVIFLDNAIKFTPGGGKVEVNLLEEQDKGIVHLSIRDSGLGIPTEELPYIWERFYKVDKARNRQSENGTGLGLFIAKQIADLHRVQLYVESTPNQGSTFTLELKSIS